MCETRNKKNLRYRFYVCCWVNVINNSQIGNQDVTRALEGVKNDKDSAKYGIKGQPVGHGGVLSSFLGTLKVGSALGVRPIIAACYVRFQATEPP